MFKRLYWYIYDRSLVLDINEYVMNVYKLQSKSVAAAQFRFAFVQEGPLLDNKDVQ